MSFRQVIQKYNISKQDFFRYLQVRDYIKRDTTILTNQNTSNSERQLFRLQLDSIIRTFYCMLKESDTTNTNHLKETWERELNVQITDEQWEEAWMSAETLSVCNRLKAIQLKILHRAHISPSQRHRFNADLSPLCPKCKIETGSLTHCLWSCRKIQHLWYVIGRKINKMLAINVECKPLYMLLGISTASIPDKYKRKLDKMLTFCARKCILLNWVTDKVPSKIHWLRIILEYLSLDFLTCRLHDKKNSFHKIWEPFMTYMDLDISAILTRGFI